MVAARSIAEAMWRPAAMIDAARSRAPVSSLVLEYSDDAALDHFSALSWRAVAFTNADMPGKKLMDYLQSVARKHTVLFGRGDSRP